MTVSGTNTFTQLKNEVIKKAYRRIGVLSAENELTAYQIQEGSDILNMMIKSWMTKGFRLWKTESGYLFVDPSSNSYLLNGSSANATSTYLQTTLEIDAVSAETFIEVEDATGFAVGNYIGVIQSNNYIHWTTIASIVGNIVELDSGLTDDASAGNNVYVYETKLGKLENIINAQATISPTIQIPLEIMSRDTYDALSTKTLVGIVNKIYYNKQRTYGIIRLFMQPVNSSYIVSFTYQSQFYDMTNPADEFDFPTEWLKALYLNLAVDLSGFYPIADNNRLDKLQKQADLALLEAVAYDDENTSIYFYPATDENRGTYS